MQQTLLHKSRKAAGILILATVFMSVLASFCLPSILEFHEKDQEQLSINLPEKEIKESYDSTDPENEPLEEIDLYIECLAPTALPSGNGSGQLFTFLTTHLSAGGSDIQIPPPRYIAA